ncbi:methylenetetrahydrofolate reductase C-terminal domain-containing protein [Pyrococcus abyssi]|uniref:5,10 methylenetetrahydrofolate reductase n=1 Tax=Pyrococcus abyssi (strain GE5 / Orsay) TaxID=272844 RepID=Q9V087_PYRAB|nr:methylenetetrahydrofolate reductase C-terminal domain-containing protein [Pyrococcus abyssi]CAB49818.1 5,10 methylenetetrahydrofolate reductase [Pyrococcus abyssi GE5]CCE70312.1 TPA: meth2-like [Pyrococcus abyssi GE5]
MRILSCPKDLLNGPCGGALNGVCEVDGRPCPWVHFLERFDLLDGAPLLVEHPIVIEMERFETEEVKLRESEFLRNLRKGKALSVEFPLKLFEKGRRDFENVNALYTIPDNPLGYPHLSSTALATWLKIKGFQVMPHVTGKDRNALAIISELRTALEFEFEGVLLTTGDWPGLLLQTKPVFDLDSPNMVKLAKLMFSGVLPTGERIELRERPFIAATMNPNYSAKVEGKRVARKLIAGADVLFTQVVASVEAVRRIPEILREALRYSSVEVPIVVSLLYPITKDLEGILRKMGVKTGSSFEEIVEEVSSLELGGINLIVFDENSWEKRLEEAFDIIKGGV